MVSASRSKAAPGRRQILPLPYGMVSQIMRDPLRFYLDGARRFGDVFRVRIGPWTIHLLTHPDHVQRVLQDRQKNYPRHRAYDLARPLFGEGLATSEGEQWRRHRRLIQPVFHRKNLEALTPVMTQVIEAMIRRWRTLVAGGRPVDVEAEMLRLTLGVASRTLFNLDISDETDALNRALTVVTDRITRRFRFRLDPPERLPTPGNLRYRKALHTVDEVVYGIIERRRREPNQTGDLLSMLLQAREEETGASLSDRELRDEVLTFLLAGHGTTGVGLAWTWHLLSLNPAAERRLRAEVEDVLGGRTPTVGDLPALAYTRMVFQEGLRLYPTAFAIARGVAEEDEIDGYLIPAGSMVVLIPYITHRHPSFWETPEAFDPERFAPERSADRPRYAYFPFAGGAHQCIGNEFAMMEAQLVIAMVTQAYRLESATDGPIACEAGLVLRPRGGVPMTISPA